MTNFLSDCPTTLGWILGVSLFLVSFLFFLFFYFSVHNGDGNTCIRVYCISAFWGFLFILMPFALCAFSLPSYVLIQHIEGCKCGDTQCWQLSCGLDSPRRSNLQMFHFISRRCYSKQYFIVHSSHRAVIIQVSDRWSSSIERTVNTHAN